MIPSALGSREDRFEYPIVAVNQKMIRAQNLRQRGNILLGLHKERPEQPLL